MKGTTPEVSALAETHASPGHGPSAGAQVELVLDSHCLTGTLEHGVVPRRLVDVLNGIDGGFVILHNAELKDLRRPEEEPERSRVMHVQRNAILFGVPRADPSPQASAFETVEKVPVPAVILLPGFEIRGELHLPPDSDPAQAPLLASSRFIPLTDATIVAVQDGHRTWRESVVVVNLARALAYAPQGPPMP